MNANLLWVALALVLILEGVLPFCSPPAWRRMMQQIAQLRDEQIRMAGFVALVAGMALLMLAT